MMNGFVMRTEMIFWHMESHFVKNGAGLLRNNYRKDKKMYLIAGLGNPTREYEKTRHISSLQADAHILSALLQP